MKITTDYWAKPIPIREYDWSAVLDGYDAGDPIGYGATEADAIRDLNQQIIERLEGADDPTFWCGRYGLHVCGECGNVYDKTYDAKQLDAECPDHLKCMRCRY